MDELICTLPESDGHTHGDECYKVERVLSCGKEETDGHAHTDACYKEESTLVCTNEDPEHVHGDGCYQTTKTLVCNKTEQPAHHHDDSCYTNEKILICGKTQAEAHHHTKECYSSQKKLICKLPEGHRNTAECYKTERSLICGKEVHEHTLQCFSNPYADIEDSSVWDRSTASVELTGDWRKDLVAIAETQLGYEESKLNYSVEADGKTMNGYSRYGAWYGRPYEDWNAMFCSFCLHYAQIDCVVPIDNNCANWVAELKKAKFYNDKEDYVPQAGDLVFFDRDSDGTAERVGIVAQVTEKAIKDSVTDEQNEDFDHPVVQASADMVEVVKEWADALEEGVNHDEDSVTIQLMQDGEAYGDPVVLNKACEWKHVFTQLPKNHVYTVEEQAVKGYIPEYSSQTIHPETGEDYLQLKVTNTPGSKIIKFRKSNEFDDPLSGAEFILCTDEACTTQVEGITLQTSDSSGYFTPDGGISLENGTYYLKETKAPDGYVPLNQLTKIVVSDTAVTMQTGINQPTEAPVDLEGTYVITVVNHSGYSLPVTGGSGTFLYYALGAMLMASALMFGCCGGRSRCCSAPDC